MPLGEIEQREIHSSKSPLKYTNPKHVYLRRIWYLPCGLRIPNVFLEEIGAILVKVLVRLKSVSLFPNWGVDLNDMDLPRDLEHVGSSEYLEIWLHISHIQFRGAWSIFCVAF